MDRNLFKRIRARARVESRALIQKRILEVEPTPDMSRGQAAVATNLGIIDSATELLAHALGLDDSEAFPVSEKLSSFQGELIDMAMEKAKKTCTNNQGGSSNV